MRKSMIMAVALAFVSLWAVMAAGVTAVWLTEEMRVLALLVLPAAAVASLLVLYFDWRREFLRGTVTYHRDEGRELEDERLKKAA